MEGADRAKNPGMQPTPDRMKPVGHAEPHHRVEPFHREPIHYHDACAFHHHGPHYYGYRVHALPHHCIHHHFWGYDYWFYEGLYYRYWNGYYYIARPPYGTWFDIATYELALNACRINYYNTVNRTYDIIDENYQTIEQQNELIAANNALIAKQNEAIAAGAATATGTYELARSLGLVQSYADANLTYYYDDGIFFVVKDGKYTTIVPPAGALVESLPEDYEVLTVGEREYYKVDDTVYRMIVNGGKPAFEVLGQMPTTKRS